MDGKPQRLPRCLVLSHLFLHHAHHRGQVHALLSQTSVPPPALDLTYFPPDGAVIDLYFWPTPNGHKVTMCLKETGLPYRLVPIDIDNGEQFGAAAR
jgi:hypothetical protein